MESELAVTDPRVGTSNASTMLPAVPPAFPHQNYAGFAPYPFNPGPYGHGFQQPPFYHPGPPPLPPPIPHAPPPHPLPPQRPFMPPYSPAFPAFHSPFLPPPASRHIVPATPSPTKWRNGGIDLDLKTNEQSAGNGFQLPLPDTSAGGSSQQSGQGIPGSACSGSSRGEKFIDEVLSQVQSENKIDVPDLLLQVRAFIAQAENAIHDVGKMVHCDLSTLEPSKLASCPYDSSHRFPPESLFRHILGCSSNPKPQVDSETLISSLHYPRTIARPGYGGSAGHGDARNFPLPERACCAEGVGDRGLFIPSNEKENMPKFPTASDIDIWGGQFFYKDCAAVVQKSLPPRTQLEFPEFPGQFEANEGKPQHLLPSRLWLLQSEIELWVEFPTRCSSLVLQAAKWLPRIQEELVLDWILEQTPAHGIVTDVPMACHIESLTIFCLQSLQREALSLIKDVSRGQERGEMHAVETEVGKTDREAPLGIKTDRGMHFQEGNVGGKSNVTCLDCPSLFNSGRWLASQLASLFGPVQSKAFVLELLKHCLVSSGRCLASVFIESFIPVGPQHGEGRANDGKLEKADGESRDLDGDTQVDSSVFTSAGRGVDRTISKLEVDSAIDAVRERSTLETYFRSLHHPNKSSNIKIIQDYEDIVKRAAVERSNRPQYRPILEHDGFVWHRSQTEEKGKNKTREELLAEERDYKRRRMSYRGKKLKRSPAEVLHDIITGHMEEIIAAGGIGRFTKDSSGPASTAIPKSESSKGSNTLMNTSSPVQKGHKEELPVVSAPANTMYGRGHWNERSREQSTGRDRWSSENSASRAPKQSSADFEVAPQSRKLSVNIPSEEDNEYERHRQKHSFRESSRGDYDRSSERHRDHHRSRSRSRDDRRESKRDYRRESESRWEESGAHRSSREDDNDTRRRQRYEHDYSDRWESSSDNSGFYSSVKELQRKGHKER